MAPPILAQTQADVAGTVGLVLVVLMIAGIIFVALWPWFILAALRRMAKAQEEIAKALAGLPLHVARLADAEATKERALSRLAAAHEAMAPEASGSGPLPPMDPPARSNGPAAASSSGFRPLDLRIDDAPGIQVDSAARKARRARAWNIAVAVFAILATLLVLKAIFIH